MNTDLSNRALHMPPEMVAELALGLDTPLTIANRHGFTGHELIELEKQPWFIEAINRKREEFSDQGVAARWKFKLMAEALAEKVFKLASTNQDPQFTLDSMKHFAKLGDLEPKNNTPTGPVGPGFSINIDLSGASVATSIKPTHHLARDVPPDVPEISVNFTGGPTLQKTPEHVMVLGEATDDVGDLSGLEDLIAGVGALDNDVLTT